MLLDAVRILAHTRQHTVFNGFQFIFLKVCLQFIIGKKSERHGGIVTLQVPAVGKPVVDVVSVILHHFCQVLVQGLAAFLVQWFLDEWTRAPELNNDLEDVDLYGAYLEVRADLARLDDARALAALPVAIEPWDDLADVTPPDPFPSHEDVMTVIENGLFRYETMLEQRADLVLERALAHGRDFIDGDRRKHLEETKRATKRALVRRLRMEAAVQVLQMDSDTIERYKRPNYSLGIDL